MKFKPDRSSLQNSLYFVYVGKLGTQEDRGGPARWLKELSVPIIVLSRADLHELLIFIYLRIQHMSGIWFAPKSSSVQSKFFFKIRR